MKTTVGKVRERNTASGPSAEERIVEAALNAFASHGFDGVSTTEIAALAGISQPMVHYHFSTKEDLWRAAVDRLYARIAETFPVDRSELRDLDAATKLKFVMRRFVLISARYPALGQLVHHEGSRGGARLAWLVKKHFKAYYTQFDRLIEAAQAEGSVKPMPSWLLTMIMTASAASIFNFAPLMKATWGKDVFDPEVVQVQADAIVEVLFNGMMANHNTSDRKTGAETRKAEDSHDDRLDHG